MTTMHALKSYAEFCRGAEVYERAIATHPYIHQLNTQIVLSTYEHCGLSLGSCRVLDAGCGTGQVARMFVGVRGVSLEGCDIDHSALRFFREQPELIGVQSYVHDIRQPLQRSYDVVILRGVLHHVPLDERSVALRNLASTGATIIVADEGLNDYRTELQRAALCREWYGHVIDISKQVGSYETAELEAAYLQEELQPSLGGFGDYKESIKHLEGHVTSAGLQVRNVHKVGSWAYGGGMYVAVISGA